MPRHGDLAELTTDEGVGGCEWGDNFDPEKRLRALLATRTP